jgi:ABC-type maltose transport system permease subunit
MSKISSPDFVGAILIVFLILTIIFAIVDLIAFNLITKDVSRSDRWWIRRVVYTCGLLTYVASVILTVVLM